MLCAPLLLLLQSSAPAGQLQAAAEAAYQGLKAFQPSPLGQQMQKEPSPLGAAQIPSGGFYGCGSTAAAAPAGTFHGSYAAPELQQQQVMGDYFVGQAQATDMED